MVTQPDGLADPTAAGHRPQPQDPWSAYGQVFPGQMPTAATPTVPLGPAQEVREDPRRKRRGRQDLWVGSAPVTRPEPDPTPIAPMFTWVTRRAKREPYVRPDLPKPRPTQAWHVGRLWSAWGLFIAFCAWGVWAANQRGRQSIFLLLGSPFLVFAVGVLLFIGSRMLGRILIGSWRDQPSRSAHLSHFITFVYFVIVSIGYLRMTTWVTDANGILEQLK